jgi:PAS domain S-box-containing protein
MSAKRRLPWQRGIQARFLPVLAAFVIVSMTALGATLFYNQRLITVGNFTRDTQETQRVLQEKGSVYSTFIARIAPQGILAHDYLLLEGYAEELSTDPDIVYFVILNSARKPITHFLKKTDTRIQTEGIVRVEPEQFMESLAKARTDTSLLIVKHDILYNGVNMGSVEIGLSQAKIVHHLEALKLSLKQELRRIAVLTGGEILVALVVLILLSKWAFNRVVVKPIQALGADMAQVQYGNLGARTRVAHDDEIGWLARSFNQMATELQGHVREIQEQRRIDKETRDYLANILDNSADMIITTSLEGTVVEFNTAAERILGHTYGEMVGKPWDRIYADDTEREKLSTFVRRAQPEPNIETVLRRKDNSTIDVELTLSPLRDNHGLAIGTVYIIRDVTHAKAMRQELIQAEKMASIGQVASWIAHQIRNVLGRLLLHVSALRPPESGESSQMKSHRELMTGIHEMDTLVTDLLEYSKTLTLHPGPMKLNASLDGLIAALVQGDAKSPLHVERDFDPNLPVIQADVFKIEQTIGNVLKNAVDAMPKGGTLRVTTGQDRHSRDAMVRIEDTGPGIRPEDLPRVFRPFFTTKPHGTGLGLAMAARIVEAHGGSIHAENLPQGGACFTFTLPETPRRHASHE